ncbi:MAG TPA: hypothetical protein VLA74_03365 [Nitrososphaeraceae archaeon]|nr:hypothetical protein [Nitrososphaeraceae archaeon]
MKASKLDVAYNREKDADVKERMLLVRRIVEDKKTHRRCSNRTT